MSPAATRNSFRRQTLDEIIDALERIGDAPDVRAVVLTSAGSRFFSTGDDVGDYWTRYRDDMEGEAELAKLLKQAGKVPQGWGELVGTNAAGA
jgi:enoyl-CoA hydratase/carnithine racemase